jgi:hypothetical protein
VWRDRRGVIGAQRETIGRVLDADVNVLELDALRRVVVRLLGNPVAQPVNLRSQRLVRGDGQGLGVYRVSGATGVGDQARSWSVIVKVLPESARQSRDHWCYSAREVLAYRSGLIADLPAGLDSPKYLADETDGAGRTCLWLEDLGSHDERWSLERLACAARCLGRFNGAYLTGVAMPQVPWLSRHWLRGWLAETAAAVEALPAHRDNPLVRRVYPPDVLAGIEELWASRTRLLNALDLLPRTLCHNDAFRRNLAWREEQLVGLDWAFLGPGPIGAELSAFVSASVAFAEVDPVERPAFEDAAVSGYLAGLREAGWHGAADDVWLGYAATSALRYGPGTVRLVLPCLLDRSLQAHAAEVLDMPFDAVVVHWAAVIRADVNLHAQAARILS